MFKYKQPSTRLPRSSQKNLSVWFTGIPQRDITISCRLKDHRPDRWAREKRTKTSPSFTCSRQTHETKCLLSCVCNHLVFLLGFSSLANYPPSKNLDCFQAPKQMRILCLLWRERNSWTATFGWRLFRAEWSSSTWRPLERFTKTTIVKQPWWTR